MDFKHQPVMLSEAIEYLAANHGRRFIDGTVGAGGHSRLLLERLPECEVLGIDRDSEALQAATANLAQFGRRFQARQGRFAQMQNYAAALGWQRVDGVLLDLGVSSHQIDAPERGFSFRFDGPLDMRMDRSETRTAADLLNTLAESELVDILFRYGEERKARSIAREIVRRRSERPWTNTTELAELLNRVVGRAHQHGLPPATRTFQALRIALNQELEELQAGLQAALALTCPGARIVVISFHSLEDRIVKHFFRTEACSCICPPGVPECRCGKVQTLRVLTGKPLQATEEELALNSRSGCAKLRAAERL
ncbi:MAG: 16S rRNA (cytosine(1402)-N(4))-methyltransferase RsmH [Lentisphaerae bacterium]|nr:16S rRNA (cytosine(1402)-N(4))-methyltransferase RsmH [Lentisphaerota bacterium]